MSRHLLGPFLHLAITLCLHPCSAQHHTTIFTPSTRSCDDQAADVERLANGGQLSLARSAASKIIAEQPDCERKIARKYVEAADTMLNTIGRRSPGHSHSEKAYAPEYDVAKSLPALQLDHDFGHVNAYQRDPCWYGGDDLGSASERWDLCCSGLIRHRSSSSGENINVRCHDDLSGLPLCCDFFDGSLSYLRLPALREVALNIRVKTISRREDVDSCAKMATCETDSNGEISSTAVISLEQDGFLRPFDISSILWPGGYLLTLCLASPDNYGVEEISTAISAAVAKGKHDLFAIELGTGIGAASIALTLYLLQILNEERESPVRLRNRALVVATDTANHALALASSNAEKNHAQVEISHLDYKNRTELESIAKQFGQFPVVIGSSLQDFFDRTNNSEAPIWAALDILLDRTNPHAIALFCHTRSDPIEQPSDARFRLVRRVSGDDFNMKTRSGESSDFELSLFRRK